MYNTDDIYSRLLAGESSDDIATEMTNALNAALDRIEEEEKARKAVQEQVAKEAHNKAKLEAAADLVADAAHFCATYYPSFGITTDDAVSDREIRALASMIVTLLDLEVMKPRRGLRAKLNVVDDAMKLPVDLELKSEPKKPMTTDEVFAQAFKMLGI